MQIAFKGKQLNYESSLIFLSQNLFFFFFFFFFFVVRGRGSTIYIYVQKVHIDKDICNLQSQGSYKETKRAWRVDHL
jgi:hypothetical protein